MFKQERHEYRMMKRVTERQENDAINNKEALMNHENAVQHQDKNRPGRARQKEADGFSHPSERIHRYDHHSRKDCKTIICLRSRPGFHL